MVTCILLITFSNSSLEFGDWFAQFWTHCLTNNRFVLKTIFDCGSVLFIMQWTSIHKRLEKKHLATDQIKKGKKSHLWQEWGCAKQGQHIFVGWRVEIGIMIWISFLCFGCMILGLVSYAICLCDGCFVCSNNNEVFGIGHHSTCDCRCGHWAAFCMPSNSAGGEAWMERAGRKEELVERVQYKVMVLDCNALRRCIAFTVCKCSFVSCRIGILVMEVLLLGSTLYGLHVWI